jgi:hypothetical protein
MGRYSKDLDCGCGCAVESRSALPDLLAGRSRNLMLFREPGGLMKASALVRTPPSTVDTRRCCTANSVAVDTALKLE